VKTTTRSMFVAAVLFSLISLFAPGKSSAEDIWCYGKGTLSYYLVSDKISVVEKEPIFRCLVNVVDNESGKLVNFHSFGFENWDGTMVSYTFLRAKGIWEYHGQARSNPLDNAVWQAMKPYLKQKGFENIYYWD